MTDVQIDQRASTSPGSPEPWLRRLVLWGLRTRALEPVKLDRRDWVYLSGVFALTRVLIIVLGVLGAAMFPALGPHGNWTLQPIDPHSADTWMRIFVHFDSGWYLGISHQYLLPSSGRPDWLLEWAFFPLYPWVLHPVSVVLHVLHVPGNTDEYAGVLVSHAALFGATVYLYRLVRAELGAAAARRSIAYMLIFPTTLFLSAVYPEGLFTLLCVGAFYHARRRQWAISGLLAAGALLTRSQGLFLIIPLGLEFLAAMRASRSRTPRQWAQAGWLGLPVLALGGYALYSHAYTGYWLAFEVSARVWGRRPTPPIYPLLRYLLAPQLGGALNFDFGSVNFATAVLLLVLTVVALRRLPASYGVWLALGALLPLSTSGHQLTSFTRYAVTVFPAFMALAAWSLRLRWTPEGVMQDAAPEGSSELRDRVITIACVLLMALFVIMFTNGIYAAV